MLLIILTVAVPGIFTQHPFDQVVQIHFDVSLKCRADSGNNLMYQWSHNSSLIMQSNHFVIKGSDLIIVNAKFSHAGQYQCIITNNDGKIASNYATVVILPYGKLHIVCMHIY